MLVSTHVASSSGDQVRSRVNFLSLPREIRDLIYEELVISSAPVHFNQKSGPVVHDVQHGLLGLWDTIPQVAREVCEVFYQRNTFVVFDGDLHSFLTSDIRSWVLHTPSHISSKEKRSTFRANRWLTKIEVFQEQTMFTDYRELGAGLRYLLTCPRLQSVVIDTGRGFWRMLGEDSKAAVEELTRRLGEGLKVHMEGSGYGGLV